VVCDLHQTADWWKPSARRWDVAAGIASLLLFFAAGRWSLEMTVAPLLIGVLLIAALHGRITSRMMRVGWLVRSGRVSYSAFLVHFPLFLVVRRFVGPGPAASFLMSFAFWAAVLLPLTFFAASGFHRWIEQPCLDGRFAMWIRTVATRRHDRWLTSRSRRRPLFVERWAAHSGLARSAIPSVASRAIGLVRETDDR
jgi:peptidoglycan/LPS O-acetylase OafA/YrhL